MDSAALLALASHVQSRATNKGSTLHGPQHWRCVSLVGVRLARLIPGADPLVAFLFGLFHDSRRVNDGTDPDHGRHGARLLREMAAGGHVNVSPEILERVAFVCETHTEAGSMADLLVGACYDADRLNLWREGTRPCRASCPRRRARDDRGMPRTALDAADVGGRGGGAVCRRSVGRPSRPCASA